MPDQPPAPQPDPRLFPVVTILRDDTTGALALQIGTRTYRTAAELKDSGDWTRVEYAARDLARWLEGSTQLERKTETRREETTASGGSMVEQINRILEGKLAGQPVSARAVRLAEGPDGSVRVYIGVQVYGLEDVPDPAIRAVIREAVEEWEARS